MVDFETTKPEKIIEPEFLEKYESLHKNIFDRLVLIHTSITIIDTIKNYPLEKLYGPSQGNFWFAVYWNFLYTMIIMIHGLLGEKEYKDKTVNLPKLSDLIESSIKDQNVKEAYLKRKQKSDFSVEIDKIKKKIMIMRHKVVAHREINPNNFRLLEIPGVSFQEIKKIYIATEQLFKCCSFGTEYFTNLYWPTIEKPEPTAEDVEEIFELLLKHSNWINSPEKHGPFWAGIREHKDKKDIEDMNHWRQKFGMPLG